MTNPAAVGAKAILGLGIESGTLGLPLGPDALKTFDWDSMEVGRESKENPNTSITGFGGRARGTPGDLNYGNGPKGDLTVLRFLMHAVAAYGSAKEIVDLQSGSVGSVSVGAGGSGYSAATVAFSAPPAGGTTATGTVTLAGDAVSAIVITNRGSGYMTAPTVTISGNGTGATATAVLLPAGSVGVQGVTVTDGGSGYSAATITFDAPPGDGVTATGTVTVDVGTGKVTAVTITDAGSGYDPDTPPTAAFAGDGSGAAGDLVLKAGGPWLVTIRPGRTLNASRGLTVALRESPYYSAMAEYGRHVSDLTIVDVANRRAKIDPTYTPPTGDSTSGFSIANSGNAGTQDDALIAVRGRRPNDSHWLAGESVYLSVTAVDADFVTFKAAYDTKSVLGDGTDFPAVSYGSNTFKVSAGGWARIIDSNDALASPIGLFGENFEPLELTIGDQVGGDMSALFNVGDEWEIPATLTLTKTPIVENRLSTYHLSMADSDESFIVDGQTTKLVRPYNADYGSGSRFPQRIDETGDLGAQITFAKTLFDRMYRDRLDRVETFPVLQSYLFGTPVVLGYYEGIEIFYPAMQVSAVKADVPNKEVLKESVTIEAVQPDVTPSLPTLATTKFEATVDYPLQINAVCVTDPVPFIGPAV